MIQVQKQLESKGGKAATLDVQQAAYLTLNQIRIASPMSSKECSQIGTRLYTEPDTERGVEPFQFQQEIAGTI